MPRSVLATTKRLRDGVGFSSSFLGSTFGMIPMKFLVTIHLDVEDEKENTP